MDRQNPYFKQVELLVKILPLVGDSSCFALKGGTAINMFIRELPRLSVDIDLVYVPIKDRTTSLAEMTAEMRKIGDRIYNQIPQVKIQYSMLHQTDYVTRIIVEANRAVVKIEMSPVLRGTAYVPKVRRISRTAENIFGFAEIPVVSFEDLFAGKILAALDRQHPRDFFDIKGLLDNEGITEKLKEAFIVYLISHNRTFLEILNPIPLDIEQIFKTDFVGMTAQPVELKVLTNARSVLIDTINNLLDERDKLFLLNFKMGHPDWSYFSLPHIKHLPAVKWKMHNLNQMASGQRERMVVALGNYFGL